MLDELLDIFDRDRRGRRSRGGLLGRLRAILGGDGRSYRRKYDGDDDDRRYRSRSFDSAYRRGKRHRRDDDRSDWD